MGQELNTAPTLLTFNQPAGQFNDFNNPGFELYRGVKLPSHLLLAGYTNRVDLSLFKHKVSGNSVRYREDRKKYMIDKDMHKGSCWKLIDRNENRIASINCKGYLVGK